jgi:histidinol-phosphate aminotransferase
MIIVDKEAVDRFIKQVPEDVIVVFDEAYYDYVEDEDYPNSFSYVLEEKNLIVLRTFSKIAGIAGVRIDYLNRVVNPCDGARKRAECYNAIKRRC